MEYKASVNLNFDKVDYEVENSVAMILRLMMEDIHRISTPITPLKDYGLRPSVTKQMVSNDKAVMRWNVNYAAAQEEGGRTDPRTGKYIKFVHYTTPGTGPNFVSKSLEQVMNKLPYYAEIGGLSQ